MPTSKEPEKKQPVESVTAKPEGVSLGTLEPSTTFSYKGKSYRLVGIAGETCHVILLHKLGHGIERLDLPAATLVQV